MYSWRHLSRNQQQEPARGGLPATGRTIGRERAGHAALEHDLDHFSLQGTNLFCQGDIRVVVYRFAVLDEALLVLANAEVNLGGDIDDAGGGATTKSEIPNLPTPVACRLHLDLNRLHAWAAHAHCN